MFKLVNSCRLCRSYDNINTTLHHIDSDNLSFFQKLNRIAPEILERNPHLPDDICINCITELNIAYKFINKCSESQSIFQRYLEQLQNGQQIQPANNREILIKVIKLEENNCIMVKDEKKSGFLNEETNDKYNVQIKVEEIRNILANLKNENIEEICNDLTDDIQTDQRGKEIKLEENCIMVKDEKKSGFLNEETNDKYNVQIKVEEEIRNILANLKNENIEEICNDSTDYIQTVKKEIKLENNYLPRPSEELKHEYNEDASQFAKIEDHSDSIYMNNEYEFTEEKDIKIDEDDFEDDFENDIVIDLPKISGHFTGFDLIECDLANGYKVKYHLKLERLAKVINNEHMKNVDKVLERSEIDENSFDIVIELPKNSGHFTGFDLVECDLANGYRVKYHLKLERLAKVINNEHMKNVDSEIGENSCNVGTNNQMFNKYKIREKAHRSNLTRHKRTRTGKKLDKSYQCTICGKANAFKSILKRHMLVHTNEKPFKCETCKKTFTLSCNLKEHIRIHTNEKPFKCETCNRDFKHLFTLKQHIRIHTNEKPFKCKICNRAFRQSSNLKQHIRIHTKEKPFKCETCNKGFTQLSDLKRHIRIHTNENPFKCETCEKFFNHPSNLKQHIRIHTNEKPFKCEICSRAFTRSSHLKRHLRIHTNEKQ